MPLYQAGVERSRIAIGIGERGMRADCGQEGEVGGDARDLVIAERGSQAPQRGWTVPVPGNQLGNHRIIVHTDFIACLHATVDAYMRTWLRLAQMLDATRRRQKTACRIFGVDARLDRVTADRELFLCQRQRLARGDPQLPFDKIQSRDHLCNRMFDLQPGVHFHEVEAATRLGNEFDSSRADVAHRLRRRNSRVAHLLAAFCVHAWRRRFFENFLITALHRTVALEQMQARSVRIRKHLHFNMSRTRQIFFEQHLVIAERRGGLPLRRRQRLAEFTRLMYHAHAFAATAGRGLDQHRIADAPGFFCEHRGLLRVAVIAGHQRHAGFLHHCLRGGFRTHRFDRGGRRPDELDAGLLAGTCEFRILRQETVARMNRLGAAFLRDIEYAIAAQIGLARMRRPDQPGLVAADDMQRVRVRLRVNGDSAYAETFRGARNAAGNFAAVRYEYFFKHSSTNFFTTKGSSFSSPRQAGVSP